jgi:hypothetical protein
MQLLLGWGVLAVLVPAVAAYINGGDRVDTRDAFTKTMRAEGWGLGFGGLEVEDVNVLVGQAVRALPRDQADRIPVEVKREVARLARRAIDAGASSGAEVIERGRLGAVRYQVGLGSFQTHIETNYKGEGRKVYRRGSYLSAFVALKVADAKEPREQK